MTITTHLKPWLARKSTNLEARNLLMLFITAALLGAIISSPAEAAKSSVVGKLTLADVRWAGTDLQISLGDIVSFMVPGNAGYMVYERTDSRGARRLCLGLYSSSGMEYEISVDLFPLDSTEFSPLDAMGLSILSAGSRAKVVDSGSINVAGVTGLDLTLRGVYVDRQMPQTDARMVLLSDLSQALVFTLVERQPKPAEHRAALDLILSSLVFSSKWATI